MGMVMMVGDGNKNKMRPCSAGDLILSCPECILSLWLCVGNGYKVGGDGSLR